jgi:hypothetical protein
LLDSTWLPEIDTGLTHHVRKTAGGLAKPECNGIAGKAFLKAELS